MSFPNTRMRRLRSNANLRRMVRETTLSVDNLIYPMFVVHGLDVKMEISTMPGVYHFSIDAICEEARCVQDMGIPAILLFGLPNTKNEYGTEAYADDGIVQKAIRALKKAVPGLILITDVCLCEYTNHGHCGIIRDDQVDNDATLDLIVRTSLSHAAAGADIIAPSDMMDGRVLAIREGLDENGFDQTPIMSYAAKFASAFYGPFRGAADCAPQFGDRSGYQMDPANRREAVKEMMLDAEEGADILMVKPALSYMDVISDARMSFDTPIAAYNVSGEYCMLKAAAQAGYIDENRVLMEIMTSLRRAGSDMIITYSAKDVAQLLADSTRR